MEFNRAERATLRDLASDVYEAEAREALAELDASFREWRKKQRLSAILQKLDVESWRRVADEWGSNA